METAIQIQTHLHEVCTFEISQMNFYNTNIDHAKFHFYISINNNVQHVTEMTMIYSYIEVNNYRAALVRHWSGIANCISVVQSEI